VTDLRVPRAYHWLGITAIEAYRSNAMFKCDTLRSIFRVTAWSKRWEKSIEMLQNIGFDSPSRQCIFNALS